MKAVQPSWILLLLVVIVLPAMPAGARPLLDCSKPEYKNTSTARSLFLWSKGAVEKVKKLQAEGTFHNIPPGAKQPEGEHVCSRNLSFRGSAHCQEPDNAQYRAGLAALLKACAEAELPPQSSQATLVDCTDQRFVHKQAPIELLLRWVDMGLSGLQGLRSHERSPVMIKAKCDQALSYAGAAHCKAPDKPEGRAAVKKVNKACADFRASVAAEEAKAKQAEIDRAAAAKASRKIVSFPRSTYKGPGAAALSKSMKRALQANGLAKSAKEVLRVQPMGRWTSGRYTDTRVPYKKITGLVLWWDKDNDNVCRFVSYNFAKHRKGGSWSPLKVQSFCMGCLEGWTRCN